MATIPTIKPIDDDEVMRMRGAIKYLTKEQQMRLMLDGITELKKKLNGVSVDDLVKKNPHLGGLLSKKIIPDANELSLAFDTLLKEKPTSPLLVNGKEIENKKGVVTPSGHYKNGWKIHDVKGDGKFQQLNIYTAICGQVDYEHRIMFKKTKETGEWKLVVCEGFDGIDLLKVDTVGNNNVYVLDYINALLGRN